MRPGPTVVRPDDVLPVGLPHGSPDAEVASGPRPAPGPALRGGAGRPPRSGGAGRGRPSRRTPEPPARRGDSTCSPGRCQSERWAGDPSPRHRPRRRHTPSRRARCSQRSSPDSRPADGEAHGPRTGATARGTRRPRHRTRPGTLRSSRGPRFCLWRRACHPAPEDDVRRRPARVSPGVRRRPRAGRRGRPRSRRSERRGGATALAQSTRPAPVPAPESRPLLVRAVTAAVRVAAGPGRGGAVPAGGGAEAPQQGAA